MLGMIANEKPSAIFKLGGTKGSSALARDDSDMSLDSDTTILSGPAAQLGISIEPIDVVMAQVNAMKSAVAAGGKQATTGGNADASQVAAKLIDSESPTPDDVWTAQ